MRYLSVCSGIEAASVAWAPLGWTAHAFAEIDIFPSAVLAHHYPKVPNYGDLTAFAQWPDAAINVLVGGTPCQSFSVAGLRAGLADPRGNLALVYLSILDRYRPTWMVWENVPGVLSSDDGRALGAFLGGLGELGYGWTYRVLDAQYFGLAQRRQRVFVVGHLGDWRRAAAVLLERASLSGHPAPRRETGQDVAPCLDVRAGRSGETTFRTSGGLVPEVAGCLAPGAHPGGFNGQDAYNDMLVAHSLRTDAFDASEDGTGRGTPIVPIRETAATLGGRMRGQDDACADNLLAVAFHENQRAEVTTSDTAGALKNGGGKPGQGYSAVQTGMQVRRLTPRECERLQGFPDDYTLIPYRGKPAADGPRYKALGNSMAVPVMAWIGRRIALVDKC
jgi:DNA (cytosine-5)-methyltransferase 1